MEAHQAVWRNARKGICEVAQGTLDALDNNGCDPTTWNINFTVLSSLAAITVTFLAPPTGALAATVGPLQVIGAVAQSVAVFPPGGGEAIPHDADAITKAMKDKMLQLVADINEAERRISEGLVGMVSTLAKHEGSFKLARPALADQSVDKLTSDDGLGYHL